MAFSSEAAQPTSTLAATTESRPASVTRRAFPAPTRRGGSAAPAVAAVTIAAHVHPSAAAAVAAPPHAGHAPASDGNRGRRGHQAATAAVRTPARFVTTAAGADDRAGVSFEASSGVHRASADGASSASDRATQQHQQSAPGQGPSASSSPRSQGALAQGALNAPPPAPGAPAPAPTAPPVPVRSLHELAAADPSLHAAAIGKNAHIRLETGRAGDLTMRLRVNDGIADIELGGAAADTLGVRSSELRRALAGEGLTLGELVTRPADAIAAEARGTADASLAQTLASAATSSMAVPARDATSAPATVPGSHAGSPSSFTQDHRQGQKGPGESYDPTGATPSAPSTVAARTTGASSSATETPAGRRGGLHVTA